MADRFFPNDMPDFVEETEITASDSTLHKLLSLPYPKTAERLLRAGLDLSETVVKETGIRYASHAKDPTLYTGALGTAFLLSKKYRVTNNRSDLDLCRDIVKACDSASRGSRHVTFICGRAGVCALGAVVAKQLGDKKLLDYYLRSFKEITLPVGVPNELLYGRAGYLWACSFLNKHIGEGTIPSTYTVFGDERFFQAAVDAAEVVWNQGLLRRVGICHGISGNAYVFLSLYRLTGNAEYLYRAKAFACFLLDRAHELVSTGQMHGGDHPLSLFEGQGGMAYLFFDMTSPTESRFPAYEL